MWKDSENRRQYPLLALSISSMGLVERPLSVLSRHSKFTKFGGDTDKGKGSSIYSVHIVLLNDIEFPNQHRDMRTLLREDSYFSNLKCALFILVVSRSGAPVANSPVISK